MSDPSNRSFKEKASAWFPGKKMVQGLQRIGEKRKENAFEQFLTSKKEKTRQMIQQYGLKPLGQLTFSILKGKDVAGTHPYFEIEFDGISQRLKHSKGSSFERSDDPFVFDIFDPTSDLYIFVFDEIALGSDPLIGRVIIPLTFFYHSVKYAPSKTFWAELMPAAQNFQLQLKYAAGIHGLKTSALERPFKPLGKVLVSVSLTFEAPLLLSYLQNSPILDKTAFEVKEHDENGNEEVSAVSLTVNFERILSFETPLLVKYMLKFPSSVAFVPIFYVVCFHVPHCLFPFLLFLLYLSNGLLHLWKGKERDLLLWADEVNALMVPKGSDEQTVLVKSTAFKMQKIMKEITNALDIVENIGNFSDFRVSVWFYETLLLLSLFVCFILYAIPLQVIFFVLLCSLSAYSVLKELQWTFSSHSLPNFIRTIISRVPTSAEMDHRSIAMKTLTVK